MRFVTFQREGYDEPAVLLEDRLIGLRGAGFADLRTIIAGGADALDRVQRWMLHPPGGERIEAASAKLLAPIPRPPKIICIGLNYRDHAEESQAWRSRRCPRSSPSLPPPSSGPASPSCCPRTPPSRITKPNSPW